MNGSDNESRYQGKTGSGSDDARAPRRVSDRRPGWTPLPTQKSAPTPLRSALDNLAQTLGLTNVDSINALFVDWPEIVGSELASHCEPRSLRDHILTIEASDQQWATELKWMRGLLVERCCEALGEGAVVDVRIVR